MSDSFCLRLLGPTQILHHGQPVPGLARGKALGLLGYLAVQDRTLSREHLADLFWPDKPASRGRANLSWLLHFLSARLPGCLEIDWHTIRFKRDPPCWLDVHVFAQLETLGDARSLMAAVDLYRGELMEGLHLEGCADWQIWLVAERERWRRRAVQATEILIAYHDRYGQPGEALRYARRVLALEPWLEGIHRQVMYLLARDGQRGAALAQYETCHRVLREELGVEPGAETQQLYIQICDGNLLAVPPARTSSAGLFLPPLPSLAQQSDERPIFVARQRELARLTSSLDRALAGQGGVVFVTGEAGQGKTALMQEFARQAQAGHPELLVATGKGNAHTGIGDPYLPFRQVLDLLTGDVQTSWDAGAMSPEQVRRLWSAFPLVAEALVKVAPDLIDTFVPGTALVQRAAAIQPGGAEWLDRLEYLVAQRAARPADPTRQQRALFRQYTRLVQSLAARRCLLLLLDDLQWSDAGTTSLLFHLVRELAGHSILVVGAYRPDEVALGRDGERHPLEPVVNELRRTWGDIEVSLCEDDPAFVEALLDTEPHRFSATFCETLARQTGGHALFTVELLRGMRKRGDLVRDEAGCWVEGMALDWDTLPARVDAVIAERIGRLPQELQAVLSVASVEGETFSAEVVARQSGIDEQEAVQILSAELDRRHRMVHAQGIWQVDSERILSRYRFRHILFQRYLYARLDAVERVHLHRLVATELEALYASGESDVEVVAGQLARHFEEGDLPHKAVPYLLQAGQRAARLSANEETIGHLGRGLDLLATLPPTLARDELELAFQVGLAVALQSSKGYTAPELRRSYARARELCQRIGQMPQQFPILWLTYTFHATRGEHRVAKEQGLQLLNMAAQAGDAVLDAMARWALSWSLLCLGELATARSHMERVITFYDPQQHRHLAYLYGQDPGANGRSQFAWLLWTLGYPEQALQRTQEALSMAEELAHPFSLAFAQGLAALLYMLLRDAPTTQAFADACLQTAIEHGFAYWQAFALCFRGWALVEQEQIQEGMAQIRQGMNLFELMGTKAARPQQLAMLARAHGLAGQADEGLALVDQALIEEHEEPIYEPELYHLRGELLLQAADGQVQAQSNAEDAFLQAIRLARQQGARSWELRATMSLCRLWRSRGKQDQAYERLAEIYGWFTEGFDLADLQEAKSLLAELRWTREPRVLADS